MRRDLVLLEAGWHMLKVHVSCLCDIPPRLEAMISLVGFSGFLVPVGGPYAPSASFLEGIVKASNSAEEIDEGGL